jgi:hypothetical protein
MQGHVYSLTSILSLTCCFWPSRADREVAVILGGGSANAEIYTGTMNHNSQTLSIHLWAACHVKSQDLPKVYKYNRRFNQFTMTTFTVLRSCISVGETACVIKHPSHGQLSIIVLPPAHNYYIQYKLWGYCRVKRPLTSKVCFYIEISIENISSIDSQTKDKIFLAKTFILTSLTHRYLMSRLSLLVFYL